MLYPLFRSLLFQMDPESAHYFTMDLLRVGMKTPILSALIKQPVALNPVEIAGIKFPNRVGLAAGFDKNAQWIPELAALGFGHIEIGTVTPQPQFGNPQPRLFRLKKDQALINRMGFNNRGLDAMVGKLKHLHRPDHLIIGGNLGKNKEVPNEKAYEDYIQCIRALHPFVDYFTLNISSPNTPGLRALQDKEPLRKLLTASMDCVKTLQPIKPVFLKIAPDLTEGQLSDILELCESTGMSGIIATNTTLDRSNLQMNTDKIGTGGLSGKPLENKSNEIIRFLAKESKGRFPIIGVGGVDSLEAAKRKREAGADLVQVYTGFIYKGPKLIRQLSRLD